MRKRKILYIINGLGSGGAEKLVVDLANEFSNSNDVFVISLTDDVFRVPELNPNVTFLIFDFKRNPLSIINAIVYIKKESFDIIHSHMPISILFSRLLKNFFPKNKLKLINSFHNTLVFDGLKSKFVYFFLKLTKNHPDFSTNVSLAATNQLVLSGIVNENTTMTISNGIDFDAFRDKVNNEKFFLFTSSFKLCSVSSLSKQKGLELGIEAVYKLKCKGVDVEYLIVGQGELYTELSELIKKFDAQEYIHLVGSSNNVPSIIKQCDCFLLPSRWEGFGLVVLEAVAFNKPIVSTRTQGPMEILGENYNLLADSNATSICNALEKVFNDRQPGYSQESIERKYNIKHMYSHILRLYE